MIILPFNGNCEFILVFPPKARSNLQRETRTPRRLGDARGGIRAWRRRPVRGGGAARADTRGQPQGISTEPSISLEHPPPTRPQCGASPPTPPPATSSASSSPLTAPPPPRPSSPPYKSRPASARTATPETQTTTPSSLTRGRLSNLQPPAKLHGPPLASVPTGCFLAPRSISWLRRSPDPNSQPLLTDRLASSSSNGVVRHRSPGGGSGRRAGEVQEAVAAQPEHSRQG
jgi:hypothetical protein